MRKNRARAGSPSAFPLPEVRESSGGILKTTLHACIGTNKIVDQPTGDVRVIQTPTYEGTIPGPTLIVEPGDKLSIDLINDLPANPKDQRRGAFPQGSLHHQLSHPRVDGLAAGHFRQSLAGHGTGHHEPHRDRYPGRSSQRNILVPPAQARRRHLPDQRWHGGLPDRQGRSRNPRRSARGCRRQRHSDDVSGHPDRSRRQDAFRQSRKPSSSGPSPSAQPISNSRASGAPTASMERLGEASSTTRTMG